MRGICFGLVLALTGCNQILGVGTIGLGDGDGGVHDTVPQQCITGSLFKACFTALPTTPTTLDGSIDTDTDPRCHAGSQPSGAEVCMVSGSNVTVTGMVRATGTRPLVVVAVQDLEVMGTIDVSGGIGNPAGSTTGPCFEAGAGGDNLTSPGGGGGGSFGDTSGRGGGGIGAGGQPGAVPAALTFVRGGCSGGSGGKTALAGGAGGTAGGALYLMGGNSVSVDSTALLLASGGGGGAGDSTAGGGGGGASGGLIGLDAPTVTVDGTVVSSGGGGGGGGVNGQPGAAGSTGTASSANGGSGAIGAGSGGTGEVGTVAALSGTDATAGGGGGGGGSVGIVWLAATASFIGGTITPDATGP